MVRNGKSSACQQRTLVIPAILVSLVNCKLGRHLKRTLAIRARACATPLAAPRRKPGSAPFISPQEEGTIILAQKSGSRVAGNRINKGVCLCSRKMRGG